jgi:hypothetical protein
MEWLRKGEIGQADNMCSSPHDMVSLCDIRMEAIPFTAIAM